MEDFVGQLNSKFKSHWNMFYVVCCYKYHDLYVILETMLSSIVENVFLKGIAKFILDF